VLHEHRGCAPRVVMCRSDDTPDYNARLGYGTDQGRWLVQQVAPTGGDAPKRRAMARTPQRVYHEIGDSVLSSEQAAPLKPDATLLRQGALSARERSSSRSRLTQLAAAAGIICLCLLALQLFR